MTEQRRNRPGQLSPKQVLEHAAEVEARPTPEIHPQLGIAVDAPDDAIDEVRAALGPGGLPEIPRVPPFPRDRSRLSSYCDSCGHVDSHAHDCPQQVAIDAKLEAEREEALERAEAHDAREDKPIRQLARELGGAIFRRIARAIDGR
jgi:hypothetical protein